MATQATTEFSRTGTFIAAGLVISYAGGTAPSGWLLCQGQAVLRTVYPQLFSCVGTTYNTQFDPTTGLSHIDPGVTFFRIPDYRGLLMRGVGTPSGLDAVSLGGYQVQKTGVNALTTNASGVHSHVMNSNWMYYGGDGPVGDPNTAGNYDPNHIYRGVMFGAWTSSAIFLASGATSTDGNHSHSLSGDNETRPINKGVNFIIKY